MEEQIESGNNGNPAKSSTMINVKMSRYNTPVFSETPFRDWINWGQDNLYPNYLVEMVSKSPAHAAIVEAKVKQIVGSGLQLLDSENKDEMAEVMKFISKSNKYESFNDIIRKIAYDYVVFGGFALNLIWSRDRSCIAEIHHVDMSCLRVQKPNCDSGEIENYYFSENWKQYMKPKFKPELIARFDTGNRIDASQILFIKPYKANILFYPHPSYIAAMNYIELDAEISNYQLNSVKNGLSPSLLINFNNGVPTLGERQELLSTIQQNFVGTEKSKFMLFFNKSKESAVDITPISIDDIDKIYTVMNESVVQNIMTAHRVTSPALLGIPSPNTMGTSQELILASELFFNQVIGPDQVVIEEVINRILTINGWGCKIELKDIQPLSFQVDETTMLQVLTKDEIRTKLGFPNLTQEQKAELEGGAGAKKPMLAPKDKGLGITASDDSVEAKPLPINENIKSLTAKQHQQLLRVIRQYSKGTITKDVASTLLRTGLGLTDDDINTMLPDVEEEDLSIQQSPEVKPYIDEIKKPITPAIITNK
jgi:hypothetical protein